MNDDCRSALPHLKKGDMAARAAERLLDGTGWLPEPLRTPGRALPAPIEEELESAISNAPAESDADDA